ncbi:hypothetical protein NJ56_10125 [Yersinia ruckeri]|nr:hypothetical protein NJ56_10125 [Yersinia ruckeri]
MAALRSLRFCRYRYKTGPPKLCKPDPFKSYILERVAAARPHWIPANGILFYHFLLLYRQTD